MAKRDIFISIMEAATNGHGILLSKEEVADLIIADGIEQIARSRASEETRKRWKIRVSPERSAANT